MTPHPATIHLALLTVEIFIPHSGSLKSKRKVTSSLKRRIRNECNASVAELGLLEEWQRSLLGVAVLGNDRRLVDEQMNLVRGLFDEESEIEIVAARLEWC
ncbi:MAG: DUF503 domain-containing protein [Thermodesulfobacteriota bacterium]